MSFNLKKIVITSLFLLGFLTCYNNYALAEELETQLIVEPILPENQLNRSVKYFDLRMSPSDQQKIQIKLTNQSSKKLDLGVSYSEAKTTSQGIIEYSQNKELRLNAPADEMFTNIVSGPNQITLSSNETKTIELMLKMPEKEFNGFVAGGVEFTQKVDESKTKSSLMTQRSYLVGILLSETDDVLPIDLSLEQTIVGTKNYKNAILIAIQNNNGNYVENLSINADILKKGDQSIVLHNKLDQVRMAPYSILETPVYTDDTLLDPGDYEIRLTVDSPNEFHKEWVQEFKVSKKDAELLKENHDLWKTEKEWNPIWIVVLLVGLVLLLGIGIMIVLKKNKNMKKRKTKNKKVKR